MRYAALARGLYWRHRVGRAELVQPQDLNGIHTDMVQDAWGQFGTPQPSWKQAVVRATWGPESGHAQTARTSDLPKLQHDQKQVLFRVLRPINSIDGSLCSRKLPGGRCHEAASVCGTAGCPRWFGVSG